MVRGLVEAAVFDKVEQTENDGDTANGNQSKHAKPSHNVVYWTRT